MLPYHIHYYDVLPTLCYLMAAVSYLHNVSTVVQSTEQTLCCPQPEGGVDGAPDQLQQLVGPESSADTVSHYPVHPGVEVGGDAQLLLLQEVPAHHPHDDSVLPPIALPDCPAQHGQDGKDGHPTLHTW